MRLYVSDLDGTLFSDFNGLDQARQEHLRRLLVGGACFTFATARVVPSGLTALGNPPIQIPMIGCGGAVLQHPDGTVLHEKLLGAEAVRQGVALFKRQGLGMTMILSPRLKHERRWWKPQGFNLMDAFIASHWQDASFVPLNDDEDPGMLDVVGLSCCGPEGSMLEIRNWASLNPGLRLEIVEDPYQKGVFVGFVQDDRASKGEALALLCGHLGAELSEVTVFGDASNDLSMFLPQVRKIAVASAIPEIKELADQILDEGDSVLHFIERELAGA